MLCIGKRSNAAIQAFFKEHFAFLEGREDVSELFRVALRVDILLRCQWFAKSFIFEDTFYHMQWNNAKNDFWFELSRTAPAVVQGTGPFSSGGGGGGNKAPRMRLASGDWHSPYSTPQPSTPVMDGGGSFRQKNVTLCVLCLCDGHTTYKCKELKTTSSKDVYCCYEAQKQKILTKQHGDRLCLFWNISANCCSQNHANGSKHICSMCGSASHSAQSRACTP
jgi:hypothetical protein